LNIATRIKIAREAFFHAQEEKKCQHGKIPKVFKLLSKSTGADGTLDSFKTKSTDR